MSNENSSLRFQPGEAVLVAVLPETVTPQIHRWREQYDPYRHTIVPHVSITYPPFIVASRWPAERPALARLLAGFPAFDVALADTGAFLAPRCVLWLRPDDGGALARIEAAIRAHYGWPPSKLPFTPHVTLGFFKDESGLRDAQAQVTRDLRPLRFRVDQLAYCTYRADGAWRVADEVALGNNNA